MTHKLKNLREDGYKADLFSHEGSGDFIRLENNKGDVIWLGTTDGTTFEDPGQEVFDDLEADYQEQTKEKLQ